ncbi:MAG: non-canonical purine NTP pyrophosphatase [Candidatus Pacearchaeota archaeon]
MEIYFATNNSRKVASLQRDLEKHNVSIIQCPLDLIEPRSSDVKEIASAKIQQAYKIIQNPTVVVDAGFYIDCLNGFPGAFVNFALETIGLEGILNLVKEKPRNCEFRECLAYMDTKLSGPIFFSANVKGMLFDEPRGTIQPHLWSKLGLIFIPEGSQKTAGEMTFDEYTEWRKISREKNSLGRQLYEWISKR